MASSPTRLPAEIWPLLPPRLSAYTRQYVWARRRSMSLRPRRLWELMELTARAWAQEPVSLPQGSPFDQDAHADLSPQLWSVWRLCLQFELSRVWSSSWWADSWGLWPQEPPPQDAPPPAAREAHRWGWALAINSMRAQLAAREHIDTVTAQLRALRSEATYREGEQLLRAFFICDPQLGQVRLKESGGTASGFYPECLPVADEPVTLAHNALLSVCDLDGLVRYLLEQDGSLSRQQLGL